MGRSFDSVGLHSDALVSLAKSSLTDFVGSLPAETTRCLDRALAVALALA